MTEKHTVKCDRCEKEERMEIDTFSQEYKLPEDWKEVDIDHAGVTGHLCEECEWKYLAIEELFMEERLEGKVDMFDESLQANIKRTNEESK